MRSFTSGYSSYFPTPYGYNITSGNTNQNNPYDAAGRVYGQNYFGSTFVVAIVSSTNATPIVLTVASTTGIFALGDAVFVQGHATNTAANNTPSNPVWKVSAIGAGTLTLQTPAGANSVGNGVGGATGVVYNTTRFGRSPVIAYRHGRRVGFLPTFGQTNGT